MNHFDETANKADLFKDEAYKEAVLHYPVDSWVYINTTKQLGVVEEVRPTPDGPRLKVRGVGSVPIEDLRQATEEEIQKIEE